MSVAPSIDYDGLVEKGAGLVHDGSMAVEDIEIPSRITEEYGDPGFTAEELREDVREFLEEHALESDPEPDEDDVDEKLTDTTGWPQIGA